MKLAPLPETAAGISKWIAHAEQDVVAASGMPERAYAWIIDASDKAVTFDELGNTDQLCSLDSKLQSALMKMVAVAKQSELDQKIQKKMQEPQKERQLLRGRQTLRMNLEFYEFEKGQGSVNDYEDLFEVNLVKGKEQDKPTQPAKPDVPEKLKDQAIRGGQPTTSLNVFFKAE